MPAADFVAAQQRLAERRHARLEAEKAERAAVSARLAASPIAKLPWPTAQAAGKSADRVWSIVSGREGTGPAWRVGQLDAELLDDELVGLLAGQVGEGVKYLRGNVAATYAAEIRLLLEAALFKLSIWDHDASYGASLQGLRYADGRTTAGMAADHTLPAPSRAQKTAYGLVSVLGRYGWTKWTDMLARRDPSDGSTRLFSRLTSSIEALHTLAAVPSFAAFLMFGRHRRLLDRILGMRLVPAGSAAGLSRDVSFEYLNRQLVWHAFTEFLLFVLPLVGVARWRRVGRTISRWLSSLVQSVKNSWTGRTDSDDEVDGKTGQLGHLPLRACAICVADQPTDAVGGSALTDVTNPYAADPCGCVYCFVCLAKRLEPEPGDEVGAERWTCLRCGRGVVSARPWDGGVMAVPVPIKTETNETVGSAGQDDGTTHDGLEDRYRDYTSYDHDIQSVHDRVRVALYDTPRKSVGFAVSASSSTSSLVDQLQLDSGAEWARSDQSSEVDPEGVIGDELL